MVVARELPFMSAHASRAGSRAGSPEPIIVHDEGGEEEREEEEEAPSSSYLNLPPQFLPQNPETPVRVDLLVYAEQIGRFCTSHQSP